MYVDEQLIEFKRLIEDSIRSGGAQGKQSMIRSSGLINLIHDAVKHELISAGINPEKIYPHLGETKPEIKLAGFLKQKNQDVCVIPSNIKKENTLINWGPLSFEGLVDKYGYNYSTNTLVINVRSQMSSLAKNADTLFERTFAEALNLHMRCPDMVLGEVYLIPVHEYDDDLEKKKTVGFKAKQTNLERYISFFDSINSRPDNGPDYAYERCALLIVDFNQPAPKLFNTSRELREAGLISSEFCVDYSKLSFQGFIDDLLSVYSRRHNIKNLQ